MNRKIGHPFQLTAARRRLDTGDVGHTPYVNVSTHSRPKAAGLPRMGIKRTGICFNSQPPEGGWSLNLYSVGIVQRFNSQPPEGGWEAVLLAKNHFKRFNSQPPEGGWQSI